MKLKTVKTFSQNRISGLDSLRFLAFLFVFLFHTTDVFYFGFLGVDFFFVLSSFLLSYLALKEINEQGNFNPKNFFFRRVLRIFPLYYLFLIICMIILPAATGLLNMPYTLPEKPWLFWLFLSNFDDSAYILPLKFLWSIAVEEQFYLLFLLLSPLFRKYFVLVPFIFLILYVSYFFVDQFFEWEFYKSVPFHFANFGLGMLGGWLYFKNIKGLKLFLPVFTISAVLIFCIDPEHILFNLVLSILFVSMIFLSENFSLKLKKFTVFEIFENLGKYTYGLYVYSGLVIIGVSRFLPENYKVVKIIIALIFTGIIAVVSFHIFEKRFLKLKKAFRQNVD